MLLTWIAEVADEPLELEPADRRVEWETNTWWLSAEAEDREALSVAAVVAAFERTASAVHARVRGTGFTGAATFYVWHDVQADQLRCSTGSVPPQDLPFGGPYYPCDDLGPIVAGFLAASAEVTIPWSDLSEVEDVDDLVEPEPEPFPVWVSPVPAAGM